MSAGGKRLVYGARPVPARAGDSGRPLAIAGRRVIAVNEEWLVEDGWWNEQPLRRRYFELVLAGGSDVIVFRDLVSGGWFRQRA